MIEIPEHLMQALLKGRKIVAELHAVEPENRAWVKLSKARVRERHTDQTGRLEFSVHRVELPRSICEDVESWYNDREYFQHQEWFAFESIEDAVQKALEYEPNWSKWRLMRDDPYCP